MRYTSQFRFYNRQVSGTDAALLNCRFSTSFCKFSTAGLAGCDNELTRFAFVVFLFLGNCSRGPKTSSSSMSLENSALIFFHGSLLRVGILSSAPTKTPLGFGVRRSFGSEKTRLLSCSLWHTSFRSCSDEAKVLKHTNFCV